MLSESVKHKMNNAKLKLFKKNENIEFIALCLYKFEWMCVRESEEVEGYVKLEPRLNRIYLNLAYLEKPDYTYNNLIWLLIHELLHILNKHISRANMKNHILWNVACDHVIETDMTMMFKASKIKPYNNQYNIIKACPSDLKTAERVYAWLEQQNPSTTKKTIGDGDTSIQVGTCTIGNQQLNTVINEYAKNPIESAKLENQLKNETSSTFQICNTRLKGSGSSRLHEYLETLLKVTIPWNEILEKAIKTNTIQVMSGRSWQSINKFFTPHNITLPGVCYEDENSGVGTLIIMADTSGSIQREELQQFASIIKKSFKYFKRIEVLHHDSTIAKCAIYDNTEELLFLNDIQREGFLGRGGTSHKPCIDYVETEHWLNNGHKNELSLVISLTDGYSDIKTSITTVEWVKHIPFYIVLTEPTQLNIPPEFKSTVHEISIQN